MEFERILKDFNKVQQSKKNGDFSFISYCSNLLLSFDKKEEYDLGLFSKTKIKTDFVKVLFIIEPLEEKSHYLFSNIDIKEFSPWKEEVVILPFISFSYS